MSILYQVWKDENISVGQALEGLVHVLDEVGDFGTLDIDSIHSLCAFGRQHLSDYPELQERVGGLYHLACYGSDVLSNPEMPRFNDQRRAVMAGPSGLLPDHMAVQFLRFGAAFAFEYALIEGDNDARIKAIESKKEELLAWRELKGNITYLEGVLSAREGGQYAERFFEVTGYESWLGVGWGFDTVSADLAHEHGDVAEESLSLGELLKKTATIYERTKDIEWRWTQSQVLGRAGLLNLLAGDKISGHTLLLGAAEIHYKSFQGDRTMMQEAIEFWQGMVNNVPDVDDKIFCGTLGANVMAYDYKRRKSKRSLAELIKLRIPSVDWTIDNGLQEYAPLVQFFIQELGTAEKEFKRDREKYAKMKKSYQSKLLGLKIGKGPLPSRMPSMISNALVG
jgi:hypothetical protein